jgi:protein kinase/serine/threonine-protein kinase
LKDIFAIQSEVAQKIAASLQATLSPQELRLIRTTPTTNLDAYALYLKGREHYYRYRKEDNEVAIEYFRTAIGLDPNYALAYAGLADAYSQRVQKFDYPKTWIDSALTASRRAIELDPNLAEGHKALGLAYDAKAWEEKALEAYKTALHLNPNYAAVVTNLANIYQRRGNLDTALSLLNKAVTLAPERPYIHISMALVYQILELDSAAFRAYHRAIALDPNQQYSYMQLGWLHLTRGELSQARALRDTLLLRTPDTHLVLDYLAEVETFSGNYAKAAAYYDTLYSQGVVESGFQLAFALKKLGNDRRAKQLLEADLKRLLAEVDERGDGLRSLGVVYVYSMLGNLPEANRWLGNAIAHGLRDYRWLLVDPRLENLQADAEFQSIIAELKARVHLMKERVLHEGFVF